MRGFSGRNVRQSSFSADLSDRYSGDHKQKCRTKEESPLNVFCISKIIAGMTWHYMVKASLSPGNVQTFATHLA